MTKKDYQLIAEVISEARLLWKDAVEAPAVRSVAYRLANALSVQNEHFDREKFLAACGYEGEGYR